MHIEPGLIAHGKVLAATLPAAGLALWYLHKTLRQPLLLLRGLFAALLFTLFMQSFHLPVGPSELHFVGAMVIYLSVGLIPTLFGFAVGLLLQGLLFNPADLYHIGINGLSLMLPLLLLHGLRHKLIGDAERYQWRQIVTLDAVYYSGVTFMVGFWLALGETATPFAAWLSFAASYLLIVAIEPLLTLAVMAATDRLTGNAARLIARP
ncbi:MAG: energy-coupling factor ABC transporter permease [Gammaproteobacteria bacterium]|nr:energy-coupling factor ABC transporter permease [Gammaproteobacteria bacterium]